jgi:hypothetical protein
VAAIWRADGNGWILLTPVGFPDEATLHTLVENSPSILPLSGSPQVAIVGREVTLGSNSADLIAIESSGRPIIIEVKLATNQEARRAIVSQVLSYAAYLYGSTSDQLESGILAKHLQDRGIGSLAEAARAADQAAEFDSQAFTQTLNDHLRLGSFRLVLVVDSAPDELVRLIEYASAVADRLVIDLVTVSRFDVNGTSVLVPQRVQPGGLANQGANGVRNTKSEGVLTEGSSAFVASLDQLPEADRELLTRLAKWAEELQNRGYVKLQTYKGVKGVYTLLPRLQPGNVGLVSIFNDNGAGVSIWRSVFEKRAPKSIDVVEKLIAPVTIKQGNYIPKEKITDQLLTALTTAYAEAYSQGTVIAADTEDTQPADGPNASQ